MKRGSGTATAIIPATVAEPPKVGFIFECQPNGPDHQVYEVLTRRLVQEGELSSFELVPRTLGKWGLSFAQQNCTLRYGRLHRDRSAKPPQPRRGTQVWTFLFD